MIEEGRDADGMIELKEHVAVEFDIIEDTFDDENEEGNEIPSSGVLVLQSVEPDFLTVRLTFKETMLTEVEAIVEMPNGHSFSQKGETLEEVFEVVYDSVSEDVQDIEDLEDLLVATGLSFGSATLNKDREIALEPV
jgi:hypothetical protein